MAHVLVAHHDAAVSQALATLLRDEQHLVTEVADGVLALAALWVVRNPVVALIDERLTPLDALDLLDLAVDGEGRLARHRYFVLTDAPVRTLLPMLREALFGLNADALRLTADMTGIAEVVENATRYLPAPQVDTAVMLPWSARAERLARPIAG